MAPDPGGKGPVEMVENRSNRVARMLSDQNGFKRAGVYSARSRIVNCIRGGS
jgi:hypothetical protein